MKSWTDASPTSAHRGVSPSPTRASAWTNWPSRPATTGSAGGAALRPHPGRTALPPRPLRHPRRRRRRVAADRRRPGAHAADPGHAAAAVAPGRHPPRHDGVRRQRPGPPRSAAGEPALAGRGGRHRRVDRGAAAHTARRGRSGAGRRRGRVHRGRPRRRARRRAGLPAQPAAGTGHGRGSRGAGRVRDERRPLPPQHGYPAAADRPRVVRHGACEVAARHRAHRHPVHRIPAGGGVPLEAVARRARRAGRHDRPACPDDPARVPGLHVPDPCRTPRPRCRWRAGPGPATPR